MLEMGKKSYRVHLKAGRERSVLRRHPWIFSGSIQKLEQVEEAQPGDLGEIFSAHGDPLGIAFVNPNSQLTLRVLRFDEGEIDDAYFRARFDQAAALRERLIGAETTALRLVNAEGDGLPGLTIDRYDRHLVVQCAALGMARLESLWLPALQEVFAPEGILDRSTRARGDVNLGAKDRLLAGTEPPAQVEILENGLRFPVDLTAGQKTGFYLDQRENRARLRSLADGARVLNAFSYSGAFGVAAGAGGAAHVVSVDTSAPGLALARTAWELNALPEDRLTTVRVPVQEFLRDTEETYDLIILDPPAFAKERAHVERATRAYKDVNLWAMKRLAPGGYLATFSCSQHVSPDLFQKVIFGASLDAGRRLQWLAKLGAGSDHPVHLDHPQGEYLKGLLLRALA